MARNVADAAALLSVLAGVDPNDPATAAAASHIEKDYTRFLDAGRLRGARLGVVRKYAGYNLDVDHLFDEALAAMKKAGAEIIDPVEIPTLGKFDDQEMLVMLYELKAGLKAYFDWVGANAAMHSLKDLIEFNEKHKDTEMKYFGQEFFLQAESKGDLSSEEYRKALADCGRMSRAEGQSGMGQRSGERRPHHGRQLHDRGGCGLSTHHRAHGLCLGIAGGAFVLRTRLE
jgi:amidase